MYFYLNACRLHAQLNWAQREMHLAYINILIASGSCLKTARDLLVVFKLQVGDPCIILYALEYTGY